MSEPSVCLVSDADFRAHRLTPVRITHFVPDSDTRRLVQALCGRLVDEVKEHSLEPTCPTCSSRLADRERAEV